MLLRINRTFCKRVQVNDTLRTVTKSTTSSDKTKNQNLIDALKNVPKRTGTKSTTSSDETKKRTNEKPDPLTYVYPKADLQLKKKLNREAAFKNNEFDKKKAASTVLEGLKLPKPLQSTEKSNKISLPNRKPLAAPVKTDEPTKWKKRSFLALVAEQKQDSKIFDALKAVATYSSKDKDESEDILVKMKVPEHQIHPSLLTEVKKPPKLLDQLTESFRFDLIQGVSSRFLRLKILESWILDISEDLDFPFPPRLHFYQWRQLVSYDHHFAMTHYLIAILEGKDKDETLLRKLRVLDETTAKPFSMLPEIYDDLIGDDEALQESWDRICEIYEEMQSQGVCVCGNPGLGEIRTLLGRDLKGDESGIEYVLKHMYVKRMDLLRTWTKEKLSKIQSVEENEDSFILIGNHVTDNRIRKTNNSRVMSEISFEDSKQSLVIDLDFVKNLPTGTRYLISNKLFPEIVNINKAGVLPFHLVMTNLGDLENYYSIRKQLPKGETVELENLCEKWTDKCHTELFPKENLVLVSPFSENELVYDPNDTYVITALAGSDENEEHKALEKAENDGIRHAKLPTKAAVGLEARFSIDKLVAILQEYRWSRDWFYACRWIDPAHFENVLRSGPFTHKQEYTYLTHRKLCPKTPYDANWALNPAEYREKYAELVSLAPDSNKLMWSDKYHHSKHNKGQINRINNYQY